MPVDVIDLPLMEDHREPSALSNDAGQALVNMSSWRGRLQKTAGLGQLGTVEPLATTPVNYQDCFFPDGTHQLIAVGDGMLQAWNGTVWGSNLSGAAGRATIPAPLSNGHYSIVNTLGKVYIAAGGDSNIIVYDPTLAPPNDLVELAHGLALGGANHLNCHVLLAFGDRLIAVRTVENGVDFPQRVRWHCLTLDPPVTLPPVGGWDVAIVGAASEEVLETSAEPLTGGFVLGERAFVTKAHEIIEMIPTSDAETVFRFESRVGGVGLIAPSSVAVAQNAAFFVGTDTVFAYDGNRVLPIGDPIIDTLETFFGNLGQDQLFPQGAIFPRRMEYWLLCDTAGSILIFDYGRQRWRSLDMTIAATGEFGPSAMGMITGGLYTTSFISPQTQTIVVNGASPSRVKTSFIFADTDLPSRTGYSSNVAGNVYLAKVRTRQLAPKRVGFRGVVEPEAIDRVNTLHEVTFTSSANTDVLVTATERDGSTQSQTVRTDAGGRGKAYFNFAWERFDLTFETTSNTDFQLIGPIAYRWSEGGMLLPADPP